MQDDCQEEFSEQEWRCPPSPFDHKASFIPLCSPEAEEHSPESCTSPIEPITPLSPFFFFPPPDYPPPRTVKSKPIIPLDETITPAVRGDKCLAEAMGYRMTSIDTKSAQLIRADALTYIEKLTLGNPKTKRPREMLAGEVRNILQSSIPTKFFTACGLGEKQCSETTSIFDDDILLRAAAKYITILRQMRDTKEKARLDISKALAIRSNMEQKSKDDEQAVERALDRLEAWCDDWLAGKLAEEDWNRLRDDP